MALPIKILMAFLMTLLGSLGALFFKFLTNKEEKLSIKKLLLNKILYFGGFLYVLASVFNVLLLRYIDYSIVYPLSAMTYVWTLFISHFILHEEINAYKIAAIGMLICGVAIISL